MWPVPKGHSSAPIIMSTMRASPIFWPKRATCMACGLRDIDSAPPASANSASPMASACRHETIACAPEPQSRLTFIAGVVSGMPASIAAQRLRYMSRGSVLMTWPKTTWPI